MLRLWPGPDSHSCFYPAIPKGQGRPASAGTPPLTTTHRRLLANQSLLTMILRQSSCGTHRSFGLPSAESIVRAHRRYLGCGIQVDHAVLLSPKTTIQFQKEYDVSYY